MTTKKILVEKFFDTQNDQKWSKFGRFRPKWPFLSVFGLYLPNNAINFDKFLPPITATSLMISKRRGAIELTPFINKLVGMGERKKRELKKVKHVLYCVEEI